MLLKQRLYRENKFWPPSIRSGLRIQPACPPRASSAREAFVGFSPSKCTLRPLKLQSPTITQLTVAQQTLPSKVHLDVSFRDLGATGLHPSRKPSFRPVRWSRKLHDQHYEKQALAFCAKNGNSEPEVIDAAVATNGLFDQADQGSPYSRKIHVFSASCSPAAIPEHKPLRFADRIS